MKAKVISVGLAVAGVLGVGGTTFIGLTACSSEAEHASESPTTAPISAQQSIVDDQPLCNNTSAYLTIIQHRVPDLNSFAPPSNERWKDINWRPAVVADFNQDGIPDLVWRNQQTGQNHIWYMQGNDPYFGGAFFQSEAAFPTAGTAWEIKAAADFNGDHIPDLVWRNVVTGENTIWYMKNQGKEILTSVSAPPVADLNWRIAGAADFNADGTADLVWRNYARGENRIWYMKTQGKEILEQAVLTPISDLSWHLETAADIDNDGSPELVWRNYTSGQDSIWYMKNQGKQIASTKYFITAGPHWKIFGAGPNGRIYWDESGYSLSLFSLTAPRTDSTKTLPPSPVVCNQALTDAPYRGSSPDGYPVPGFPAQLRFFHVTFSG